MLPHLHFDATLESATSFRPVYGPLLQRGRGAGKMILDHREGVQWRGAEADGVLANNRGLWMMRKYRWASAERRRPCLHGQPHGSPGLMYSFQ